MLTEMTEANLRRYMENMGQDPEDIEETLCVLITNVTQPRRTEMEKPTMEQVWGERCSNHQDKCPVCEAYKLADAGVEVTEEAVFAVCYMTKENEA
jgi:hypothetical protein